MTAEAKLKTKLSYWYCILGQDKEDIPNRKPGEMRQITCKAKEIDEELWIYSDSSRISLLWLSLMSKTFIQRHSCLESWELNDCCSRVILIFPIYGPDISSISPSVQPTQRFPTVYITLWCAHSQLSTHIASSLSKAHVQFCQLLLTDFKK